MIGAFVPESVNILLVEDDEVDVELLKRMFKSKSIANPVYHATSGVEALEFLRGSNQKPKMPHPYVMLVDINMPRMNGLDFLRELRRDHELKGSVAFILTTSGRDADIREAYELNAAGYFLKENIGKVIDVIGLYRQINRFPENPLAAELRQAL